MTNTVLPEPPQFPAGPFVADEAHDDRRRELWIDEIQRAPARLREVVSGLSGEHLDTRYRNWTIRQIVHHLADSHLNSYVRFKLVLTEQRPTIKPYDESRWSLLADAQRADVEPSLWLLEGLHARWVTCFGRLRPLRLSEHSSIRKPRRLCRWDAPSPTTFGTPVTTLRRSSG